MGKQKERKKLELYGGFPNEQKVIVFGGKPEEYEELAMEFGTHENKRERFAFMFLNEFPKSTEELGPYLACNVIVDLDGDEAQWRSADLALRETCQTLGRVRPYQRKNLIIVTSTGQYLDDEEIVGMLGFGVDLFLKKPIEPTIFAAQFRAAIGMLRWPGYRVVTSGDLHIDYETCRVWRKQAVGNVYDAVELTMEEYRLLVWLLNGGERIQVLSKVFWPLDDSPTTRRLQDVFESLNKKTGRSFEF